MEPTNPIQPTSPIPDAEPSLLPASLKPARQIGVKSSPIIILLLVLLFLAASGASAYLYFQNRNLQQQLADLTQQSPAPTSTPAPVPTETATPSTTPAIESTGSAQFICPTNGWVDCMPTTGGTRIECSARAINWYEQNCPNFEGVAY